MERAVSRCDPFTAKRRMLTNDWMRRRLEPSQASETRLGSVLPMPDFETGLLLRAREGDLEAFAEFVRVFERRVRSVLARLLDDERDIDEAAQDTFVQAWRNLGRFRGEAGPFTWLYRIAVNEALQRNRRRRLETQPLEDAADVEARVSPESTAGRPLPADVAAGQREDVARLVAALRALPFESRAPLVLRDIEGWSYEDVALVLGLSVSAAKSRVHRARLQVIRSLTGMDPGGGLAD
jgi:RNA polymerase sigma-70 factor (ECF subfamily)